MTALRSLTYLVLHLSTPATQSARNRLSSYLLAKSGCVLQIWHKEVVIRMCLTKMEDLAQLQIQLMSFVQWANMSKPHNFWSILAECVALWGKPEQAAASICHTLFHVLLMLYFNTIADGRMWTRRWTWFHWQPVSVSFRQFESRSGKAVRACTPIVQEIRCVLAVMFGIGSWSVVSTQDMLSGTISKL